MTVVGVVDIAVVDIVAAVVEKSAGVGLLVVVSVFGVVIDNIDNIDKKN